MSGPAIEIETLRKRYHAFPALDGVQFTVPAGSVFGLLGPNGAGKSTLVKSLLTIVRPDECRGTMLGQPIGHRKTLAKVGYLPEQAKFQDYLTGRQVITYSANLTGMGGRATREKIAELIPLVGMTGWEDKPVGSYSKGMRQRIGLAQALVNSPELVFLDEPTDGVDPLGRIEIVKIIRAIKEEGRTVFLNSHLLSEIEQVADFIVILGKGKVLRSGRVDEITRGGGVFRLTTVEPVPLDLRQGFEREGITVAGNLLTLKAEVAAIQPVIDVLRSRGLSLREVKEDRYTLEEVFLREVQEDGGAPL